MNTTQKGFTLIELLVVIAIIAVLSVVVILTLNPAELLRQARDSNRVSDLNTLKSAISLFLADVSTSSLALGTGGWCYAIHGGSSTITTAQCIALGLTSATGGVTTSSNRSINGVGWIPIDFTAISTGAPLGSLPQDPLGANNTSYYYAYTATSTFAFKMAGRLESTKYATTDNLDGTDGGNSIDAYEVGTMSL